ncbi:MAG: D-glycero-beta-D-manno-heptose-7-phosphate kinase [Sphingobacteriaceae bacterium]|nr:MAG: D-glycero-beta-D-manno-heptose-7-phosphate kinase [Sphingobacteriaceae bacterium]
MIQNTNTVKKILVIGDLMLDHYIYGSCSRISPEAPVQVVDVKTDEYTLGGAGNVLKNLKAFGCDTYIITAVGNDEQAKIVDSELKKIGVSTAGLFYDDKRCTIVKSRVMVANHQLIRLDYENKQYIENELADLMIAVLQEEVNNFDLVLVSDYAKGLLSDYFLKSIFSICGQAGVITIIDPKGTDYQKYFGGNIIKPNKKEAMQASGVSITNEESLTQACRKLKGITGCDNIIVTMSEEGIAMYSNNKLSVIPTKALSVIDVTGAGDTVLASLGLAIALGKSLEEACDFANHAAAVVVSKVGSATATLAEIANHSINHTDYLNTDNE